VKLSWVLAPSSQRQLVWLSLVSVCTSAPSPRASADGRAVYVGQSLRVRPAVVGEESDTVADTTGHPAHVS
jgi:hypothetical protein